MSGLYQFLIAIVLITVAWLSVSLWRSGMNPVDYFRSDDGKGALKSAGLGVGAVLVVLFILTQVGCAPVPTKYGTLNNGASVYAGLDYTNKISPMCEPTGPDSHTTSNLGLRYHAWVSADNTFRVNGKYTHHSCAWSPDDEQYDTLFGAEAVWYLDFNRFK